MVKYSWALLDEKPIHIGDVTIEMRNQNRFFNVITKKRMTAYLEGKFKPHFHHVEPCFHDNESYLHETAKIVFATTYHDCLMSKTAFHLEHYVNGECHRHYKQTGLVCKVGKVLNTFDLTRFYDKVLIEKEFNEFRPDLQLIPSTQKDKEQNTIFIEIFVTHKSNEKKLSSAQRIIEIEIGCEDDILKLRTPKISVKDRNVKFFNFKRTSKAIDNCSLSEKGCRTMCYSFLLYKNGCYDFLHETIENTVSEVESQLSRLSHVDYQADAIGIKEKKEYIQGKIHTGMYIKDCRFCRYVSNSKSLKRGFDSFCKFLRKDIRFNSAQQCDYFRKPS